MATKTFKIGLSTSDKSSMAQDAYERLIAMCFDEYDSTQTYNEGDFVVYENPADTFKLYKCKEDNVTGTWNSAKWELATFQDLVDDVEGAVASVDGKANVDGNYPTMTVGLADNLTPYDEESGDDQDEPFSFQATGTANGTQGDFATGSNALLREKQGATYCVNQLLYPVSNSHQGLTSTYDSTTHKWHITGTTEGYANIALNSNTDESHLWRSVNGHKYLVLLKTTYAADTQEGNGVYVLATSTQASAKRSTFIFEATLSERLILAAIWNTTGWVVDCYIEANVIDLTQWFNGDIPEDLTADTFFNYYQGSLAYNTGTLVNANSQYIKCIGRQQWDEEWESGGLNLSTGAKITDGTAIRSKNYIEILPNATYFGLMTIQRIAFYDKDKNYVGYIASNTANTTFTTPNNASYMLFYVSGTTYNHDITISIYYSGESGYDQYYPYEVLTNTDTGTETLRSAGSVKDYKTPDGVVHRVVGSYTFTGSEDENWQLYTTEESRRFYIAVSDFKGALDYVKANIACDKLQVVSKGDLQNSDMAISAGDSNTARIMVRINSSVTTVAQLKTWLSSNNLTVYYELDTPTTEQGTTFSPNLVIDDFGSMEFAGTSGVPQGNLIFYPVDYKAFIDTLYNYTDGTPSELALKSDLSADKSELQGVDAQLQNAIGGTLRQILADRASVDFNNTIFIDVGEQTISLLSDNSHTFIIYTANLQNLKAGSKIVSTLYQDANGNTINDSSANMLVSSPSSGTLGIRFRNDSYSDVLTFKAAMKGVLLAYEKA